MQLRREVGLVQAPPPEEVPELAQDRPPLLVLHGVLRATGAAAAAVVAHVKVVELVVVVVHGRRGRRRLELREVAQRREHPVLAPREHPPGVQERRRAQLALRGLAPPLLHQRDLRRRLPGRGAVVGRREDLGLEVLGALPRRGLADTEALVLPPQGLQVALLVGGGVPQVGVLAADELERLRGGVGVLGGPLQRAAQGVVLVPERPARPGEVGVLPRRPPPRRGLLSRFACSSISQKKGGDWLGEHA